MTNKTLKDITEDTLRIIKELNKNINILNDNTDSSDFTDEIDQNITKINFQLDHATDNVKKIKSWRKEMTSKGSKS